MALTKIGSFPAIGVAVFEEDTAGAGDKTITHGLSFTPKVYAVVAIDAAGSDVTAVVKSEGPTDVVITGFGAGLDKVRVVLGP